MSDGFFNAVAAADPKDAKQIWDVAGFTKNIIESVASIAKTFDAPKNSTS